MVRLGPEVGKVKPKTGGLGPALTPRAGFFLCYNFNMHNPELGFQPQTEEKNEKKNILPGKKLLAAFLAISEFFSSGALAQKKDKIQTDETVETGVRATSAKLSKQEIELVYKKAGLSYC